MPDTHNNQTTNFLYPDYYKAEPHKEDLSPLDQLQIDYDNLADENRQNIVRVQYQKIKLEKLAGIIECANAFDGGIPTKEQFQDINEILEPYFSIK